MPLPERPGWYDDPESPDQLRYFDGVIWTGNITPRSTRSAEPQPRPAEHGPMGWQVPPGAQGWRHPGQATPPPPGYGRGPAVGYPAYGAARTTPDGQPLASYGQRVGAFVVDGLIRFVLNLVFGGYFAYRAMEPAMNGLRDAMATNDPQRISGISTLVDMRYLWLFAIVTSLVALAYNVFFLTWRSATPGKLVTGISVRERSRPGVLTRTTALRRYGFVFVLLLLQNVPALGLFAVLVWVLDLLWPLWDDKRQALHDKVAGTNVVVGPQPRKGSATELR